MQRESDRQTQNKPDSEYQNRENQTKTQTDRESDRQTENQTDRELDRQTEKQTSRERIRHTDRKHQTD